MDKPDQLPEDGDADVLNRTRNHNTNSESDSESDTAVAVEVEIEDTGPPYPGHKDPDKATAPDDAVINGLGTFEELRYQSILDVIEHNTSGPGGRGRAGVTAATIMQLICFYGRYSMDAVEDDLKAARQEDVFRWQDEEGVGRYSPLTEAGVQAVIGEQNSRDRPDDALIHRCIELLEELRAEQADDPAESGGSDSDPECG